MSSRHSGIIWECDLPMVKKVLLLKYADNCNERDECWPSKEYVARHCNCSLATVKRYLRELRDDGVLVVIQPGGGRSDSGRSKTTLYKLDLDKAINTYGMLPTWREMQAEKACAKGADSAIDGEVGKSVSQTKGVTVTPLTGSSDSLTGSLDDPVNGVTRRPPNLHRNLHLEKTRAEEAADPDGPPLPPAHDEPGAAPEAGDDTAGDDDAPINTHWLACQNAVQSAFDSRAKFGAYQSWIKPLIAHHDDGETLVLAAPGSFHRDYVRNNYLSLLQDNTERDVEIIVTGYSVANAHKQKRDGHASSRR